MVPKKRKTILYSSDEEEEEEEDGTDILRLIGEPEKSVKIIKINPKLKDLWEMIIKKGLDKESKNLIKEKVSLVENCNLMAPKLNKEIEHILSSSAKTRDLKYCEKQDQLGLVIANLNKILIDTIKDKDQEKIEIISDSIRLLCDVHHLESQSRRAVILPGLNKEIKDSMEKTEISDYLFGSEVTTVIKQSKDLVKSSKELKPLNYWGPSTSQQQARSGQQRGNYITKVRSMQQKYRRIVQARSAQVPAAAPRAPAAQRDHHRGARSRRPRPARQSSTRRRD